MLQQGQCRGVCEAVLQVAKLHAGSVYLDVGCGAGLALSLAAASTRHLYGLNAAAELLRVARKRIPFAELHEGDLMELPFAEASFDLVTGFNAFQYASRPVLALAEARRVARPEAQVVAMTWAPPTQMPAASLVAALKQLLPVPETGAPGPFALSDPATLRRLAQQAGLTPEQILDIPCPWHYNSLEEAVRALNSSGVAARARAAAGEAAVTAAHRQALRPFEQTDGSYSIGASFLCLFARA